MIRSRSSEARELNGAAVVEAQRRAGFCAAQRFLELQAGAQVTLIGQTLPGRRVLSFLGAAGDGLEVGDAS